MIPRITAANADEDTLHHFVAEASTLRLQPGCWPRQLPTDLGNGQPFILTRLDGDWAVYRQSAGCISLTIFND